jgi:hypothetical protein
MTFTPRQWIILLVLITGFAITALAVRSDGSSNEASLPPIDTAAWCSAAAGLEGTGGLFTGEATNATVAEVGAVKEAIFAVEVEAPWELRQGLARLGDLAQITKQELEVSSWPDALSAARAQVDESIVDQALADLDDEMQTCGLAFYS